MRASERPESVKILVKASESAKAKANIKPNPNQTKPESSRNQAEAEIKPKSSRSQAEIQQKSSQSSLLKSLVTIMEKSGNPRKSKAFQDFRRLLPSCSASSCSTFWKQAVLASAADEGQLQGQTQPRRSLRPHLAGQRRLFKPGIPRIS